MKSIGVLLWVVGILVFLGAVFFDASVASGVAISTEYGMSDRIVNLDLQQLRGLVGSMALAMFVSGVLVHAMGHLSEQLEAVIRGSNTVQLPASNDFAETDASLGTEGEMAQLGVTLDVDSATFQYGPYRYEKLADALAHARREKATEG